MNKEFIMQGGAPITTELATDLRNLVFGTSAIPMRAEWLQTSFVFGTAKEELAYGLRSPRNATRGLLSVVQGFVLKYLLFARKSSRAASLADPLLATAEMQREALFCALLEILRIISDKGKVTMVLPSEDEVFVDHSASYFHDSVTEKLYVFTLSPNEELEHFLKRNFKYFSEEETPGTLLFLYSAVLTRSMGKVRTDLDSSKSAPLTMSNNEEGSLMIVTLLLTGRATPYLHNGVVNVGDENSYAVPQYGVLKRCMIGFLLWDIESSSAAVNQSRQPGSRLKTPNYPIWITSCTGHYGVIFNRNPDLLRNYHAESRFDVNYYSCSGHQIRMTIDNRTYNEQALVMLERQPITPEGTSLSGKDEQGAAAGAAVGGGGGVVAGGAAAGVAGASGSVGVVVAASGASGGGSDVVAKEESTLNTPLQRLIHTKWEEATISFHVQPSMLSYLFSTTQ
ncbi:inactive ubiquitin carboxyl-terminal hydrolase MINDY-4B [Scaptodrosophila lebanonensis]|uniref:Ubiquitin carboxyl-terminal hydrolase MINDY n=1 Tax=Drosophila lebanonensis TaxID=7225 RepID=A0A6J2TDH6_DROLE|nr:inactive ubiquitin carboxyl-terminal hydrolase MINDY-4B [Scaptodrosophila lebanonensis]